MSHHRRNWFIVGSAAAIISLISTTDITSAQSSFRSSSLLSQHTDHISTNGQFVQSANEKGKRIFSAVHFLTGETIQDLESIDKIRHEHKIDSKVNADLSRSLIATIESAEPDYFESYTAEMTSGNPARVEVALEGSQDKIRKYLEETHHGEEIEMTPQACSIGVGGCVWTVALAWNYGAAVNIGAAINVYTVIWGPDASWSPFAQEDPKLQRQVKIANLTEELSKL